MSGERIDYGIERQRHDGFVGRAALLDRLDQLLVADRIDRWVVLTGGPGMGKSAVLAAWLTRREAAGAVVPHHFIRRGEYDWDDPAKLVSSLVAQIEERFPDQREPAANAQKHPAARLVAAMARVSANELVPRGEHLVVLIDGLDEYDPPASAPTGDPLAAFLPHVLPRSVSFLCASRPRHPYLPMLETRDGELVRIDLDDPDFTADNDATVRGFWEQAAPPLALDARFVDEAVARANGNLQHAVTLGKHLAGLPAAQRRVEAIPRGLTALLVKLWERIATDPVAVCGLGILCAAREGLTLDELGAVAGWAGVAQRQAFVRVARELLVETQHADQQPEFRPHHESIRAHIAMMVGASEIRKHHAALAQQLATWPPRMDQTNRRYALRHALIHRAEAGNWIEAWRIAADMSFLEAKCRELGAHEAEADVVRTAERYRVSGEVTLGRRFDDLARALVRESHWLRDAPEATAALVWNRLRRSGWSTDALDERLQIPAQATFLRVRHTATRESAALMRDLVGSAGPVNACAVTPDGRRVVSACYDGTLKIWDLDSGRALATFEGHAQGVNACAVTPDGRLVVSASDDGTLKVWDLDSARLLTTFEGHADSVSACAVTPDGRRVVSASAGGTVKVWDIASGRVLVTFRNFAIRGNACAVTPDGRRVVSVSGHQALTLWDLDSGLVLATFEGSANWVKACAVTPDGCRMVSAHGDGTLKVWDLDSACLLATFAVHAGTVNACAVTPDGRRVISASKDLTLKVWDIDSGRVLGTFEGHAREVFSCAVTPDGHRVISASEDQTLKVWDLNLDLDLATSEGHAHGVTVCAVTPDGRRLLSASHDETLKVWDLDSGRILANVEGSADWVPACVVMPDGEHAVSASWTGALVVWDIDSGRVLSSFEGHTDGVTACTVTPDGRRVVAASHDRTLKAWNLENGRLLATFEGHTSWVAACAVTPDGQRVVSASGDQTLKVWDLESGSILATFEGHADRVAACAVTPDGQHVVSASGDRTLKVWDLESGSILATFEGHADWVNACAVTPDGRHVVSVSEDRTLRVWDLDTYACILTHHGSAPYSAVAATATGVVAGDVAGTIWFLDWPPGWLQQPTTIANLPDNVGPKYEMTVPTPAPSSHHRLRILHLSDLHLRGPREADRARRTRVLGANWLANLAELRKDGAFDLVVFTGDIAFGGALDEYLELMRRPREDGTITAWLDETLAAAGCTRAQLYVVPGNHDIDRRLHPGAWGTVRDAWSTAGADDDAAFARWIVRDHAAPRGIEPALRGRILERQAAYRAWVAHGLGCADLLPDPRRSHLGYRATIPPARLPFPVHIIGLDSAWLAGDDHDARKLRLTDDQILRLCTNTDGEHLTGLRLALVHHPLADLADGERARRLLQEHGIELLLSGHLHESEAREIATPDGRLRDLATGCLYQHDRYRNAVTALTLDLDDSGHVRDLEFRFRGWSDRGHWHDDNSLYQGSHDGRLVWPPRTAAGRTS